VQRVTVIHVLFFMYCIDELKSRVIYVKVKVKVKVKQSLYKPGVAQRVPES